MSHAYPEDLLHNSQFHIEAQKLESAGFINKDELQTISTGLPALNTQHNLFAWLGLLLFTLVLVLATLGLMAVISGENEDGLKVMLFIIGGASFVALEYFIKTKRYFNFGVDNALLATGILFPLLFLAMETEFNHPWVVYMVALAAGIICSYRYVDGFAALVACLGFTGFVINICMNTGDVGQSIMPFAVMAAAGNIFYIYRQLKKMPLVTKVWNNCLQTVYLFSIILFYAAGNYMVVRTGREELIGQFVADGSDIPLAWLFYAFTMLVPCIYIYTGLKNRNRPLLQIGILALAFGAYSIRYYHQVLPIEWGLIAAGSILFTVAYYSIRSLKNKTEGIVFKADRFTNSDNLLNTEALIIVEGLKLEPAKQQDDQLFGGGQFGGGGAEGNF